MNEISIDELKELASFDLDEWRNSQEAGSVLWEVLTDEFQNQVVTKYHLQQLLDADLLNLGTSHHFKDGGNISTQHNANNGVFVDSEHERRYNKDYSHKDYEGRGERTLSNQRKKLFQSEEPLKDTYTGKEIPKDGGTHLDHITSAKNIHDNDAARLYMTDDARNDMATADENMAPTDKSINSSKGEEPLDEWMKKKKDGQTNAERYEIDKEKAEAAQKKSEKYIKRTVKIAHLKEIASGANGQGIAEAKRQAIGVIILEFQTIFIADFQQFIREFGSYKALDDKVNQFKKTLNSVGEKLKHRLSNMGEFLIKIFGSAAQGWVSGVVGALLTALINSFITTFKNVTKLIQTGVSSLVEGVKVLILNPDQLSTEEKIKTFIKVALSGISVALGLMLEDGIKNALIATGIPATIAGMIGGGVGLLSTTILTGLTVYFVDHFDEAMQEMQAVANTIMFGITVSASAIKDAYVESINKIDEIYRVVLSETVEYYAKMNTLADMAHDFNLPPITQFRESVRYARESGVSGNDLLESQDDIIDFFES